MEVSSANSMFQIPKRSFDTPPQVVPVLRDKQAAFNLNILKNLR